MEDDVQLLVAGTQLLGVGMVVADGTVTAYGDNAGEVAQGHNLGLQLAGVLGRVFGCAYINDVGGAGITFGSNKVRNNPRHCVNPPQPIPDP